MKRVITIVLFTIIGLSFNIENINAAHVSSYEYTLFGETYSFKNPDTGEVNLSKFLGERDADKTISEICMYERSDKDGGDAKFLYIFTDQTAAISWSGNFCNSQAKEDGSVCIDDGIKNWSKNLMGVQKNLPEELDAAEAFWAYENERNCPAYLAQSQDGSSNYFYLSTGSSATDLSKIKSKANNLDGTTYLYYNVGEEPENFTKDITCQYTDVEDSEEIKFTVDFSNSGFAKVNYSSGKKIKVGNENVEVDNVYLNSRVISSTYLSQIEKDMCPKTLDACYSPDVVPGIIIMGYMTFETLNNFTIFGDSSISENFCSADDSLNFYCVGDNCSEEDICQVYSDYMVDIKAVLNDYKSQNSSTKRTKYLNEYNLLVDELKGYCNSYLKTLNYAEGNCVSSCLQISSDLASLEEQYGLRSSFSKIKCNIGESVLSLVYNVLKWVKYIVPALIVILSILDFIKAIASQNEDDMKKAQGKFVKRLIVAAIFFLLPLIINFMLKTFGLYSSACDITDLLG